MKKMKPFALLTGMKNGAATLEKQYDGISKN